MYVPSSLKRRARECWRARERLRFCSALVVCLEKVALVRAHARRQFLGQPAADRPAQRLDARHPRVAARASASQLTLLAVQTTHT